MSQHRFIGSRAGSPVTVTMGYDRPLDYVFCTIFDHRGDVVYSNLSDEEAGCDQQSVDYYREVLATLDIVAPDTIFTEVAKDQLRRAGNRDVVHTFTAKSEL